MRTIKDGSGEGHLAKVDAKGRLVVKYEENQSQPYFFSFTHIQNDSKTDETIGYITYLGEKDLVVSKILFYSESKNITKFKIMANPTGISGGLGIDSPLDVRAKHSANNFSHIKMRGGTYLFGVRLGYNSQMSYDLDLANYISLSKGDTLFINSNSAYNNDNVGVTLFVKEVDKNG